MDETISNYFLSPCGRHKSEGYFLTSPSPSSSPVKGEEKSRDSYENNHPIFVIPASEPESTTLKPNSAYRKKNALTSSWIVGSSPTMTVIELFSSLMVRHRRMGDCFVASLLAKTVRIVNFHSRWRQLPVEMNNCYENTGYSLS